jgi:hypothetical protein
MTMPETPVATNLNEALDIKVNLFSKLALNPALPVNKLAKAINLIFGKVVHLNIRIDTGLG